MHCGLNDAPSFNGLDANHSTAYIQNGTPLVIDANAVLSDLDLEATTEQSGLHAHAVELDGSGDRVDIADSSAVDFTANFSLEAWFNPTTATGNRVIIGKENSYLLGYRSGELQFALKKWSLGLGFNRAELRSQHLEPCSSGSFGNQGNTTIYLNGGDAAGGSQKSFTSGSGYRSPIDAMTTLTN